MAHYNTKECVLFFSIIPGLPSRGLFRSSALVLAYASSISPDSICLSHSVRFIGVELHGEESSVTFSRFIGVDEVFIESSMNFEEL